MINLTNSTALSVSRSPAFIITSGGIDIGGADFPAPFVVVDTPRGTVFYDSLGNYAKTNASPTGGWNDQLEENFTASGGLQDMSSDGLFLLKSYAVSAGVGTKFLINDDSGTDPAGWVRGATYWTSLYNALTTDATSADFALVFGGTNDANASSGVTKSVYKQALAKFKEFYQADFVNSQFGILVILGRIHGGSDANAQIVREAQLETIAEDDWWYKGAEIWGQPYRDSAHPTDASFIGEIAEMNSDTLKSISGKIPLVGTYGMSVYGAQFETASVLMDIKHDGGDDITIVSGSSEIFGLDIDGTIHKATSLEKVTTQKIRAFFDGSDFDADDIGDLKVVYGAMDGLTEATPETIKDNATTSKYLQSSVLTPTVINPMIGKDFSLDLSVKLGTRTGSPAISAVTDRSGQTWNAVAGREATYDATKLGNFGALVAPDDETAYVNSVNITALAWNRVYLVMKIPDTVPAGRSNIFGWGTSAGAQTTPRTSLRINGNGELEWHQNNASGIELLSGDVRGQTVVICLDVPSTGEMNVYINEVLPSTTFDPRDNIPSQTRCWIFGGDDAGTGSVDICASGLEIGYFNWHTSATEPVNIPTIEDMMNYLMDQSERAITVQNGLFVTLVGSSLTDYGYNDQTESGSTDGFVARGMGAWGRFLTKQNLDWTNRGVAGSNIQDAIDEFSTQVTATKPEVVIAELGTNDSGKTYAQIIALLDEYWDLVEKAGIELIRLTIPMRGVSSWDDTVRDKMLLVNDYIKTKANFIEVNQESINPATNRPLTGMTTDDIHKSNQGAYFEAKAIVDKLRVIGSRDIYKTALSDNPAMSGSSGNVGTNVTGDVPDDYRVTGVGSPTSSAVCSVDGSSCDMEFTAGAGSGVDEFNFRYQTLNTAIDAGTIVELLAYLKATAWDGWAYIQLRCYEPGNISTVDLYQDLDGFVYPYPEEAFEGLARSDPGLTVAGTYVRLYVRIGIKQGTAGNGTLNVSGFQLQELYRRSGFTDDFTDDFQH